MTTPFPSTDHPHDPGMNLKGGIITLEPFEPNIDIQEELNKSRKPKLDFVPKGTEKTLLIHSYPLESFESIAGEFEEFGDINKILVKLISNFTLYKVWIHFDNHLEVLRANSVST